MSETKITTVKDPGPFKVPARLYQILIALGALGIIAFLFGLKVDAQRAWSAWLFGYVFFLFWGLCGLFFTALHHATGAMWSTVVRRISEGMASYLPVAAVLFLVLLVGSGKLYAWGHPEIAQIEPPIESDKLGYLNTIFFSARNLIILGIWIFFAAVLIKNSLKQDETGDPLLSRKSAKLSVVFFPVFGITFTVAVFDMLMSLEPHWYSTIFGVYCFAGLFQSGMAFLAILAIYLRRRGVLEGIFNANHLQDVGNWMFAFAVFSAYIGFSQYMLIWYANMPEETFYLITRRTFPWGYIFLAVVFLRFFFPFFLLMGRDAKRSERVILLGAALIILGEFFDIYLMIGPALSPQKPLFGWIELGTFLGFLGIFGATLARFFSRHSILAARDPNILASLNWRQ